MPELYDDAFEIKMDEDILRERLELSLSRILDEPLSLKDGASRSYFEFEGSKIAGFIGRAMAGEIGDSPVKETSYQRDLASFEVCSECFGRDMGSLLFIWDLELFTLPLFLGRKEQDGLAALLETHIQLLNSFEEAESEDRGLPSEAEIRDILYSYIYDYAEDIFRRFYRGKGCDELPLRCLFDPLGGLGLSELVPEDCLAEHRCDLSPFLGDRLKARLIEAIKKQSGAKFPGDDLAREPETAACPLSYTERQQHIISKIYKAIS